MSVTSYTIDNKHSEFTYSDVKKATGLLRWGKHYGEKELAIHQLCSLLAKINPTAEDFEEINRLRSFINTKENV